MCRSRCIAQFRRYKFISQFPDRSGVRSRGLFQPSDVTIKSNKRWSSLSVCSDRKFSFYFVLISRNEANRLSLFVLALGL